MAPSCPVVPSLCNSRSHQPTYWKHYGTDHTLKSSCVFIDWLCPPTKCKGKMSVPLKPETSLLPALREHPGAERGPHVIWVSGQIDYTTKGDWSSCNSAVGTWDGYISPPQPWSRSDVNYNHPDQLSSMIKTEQPHRSSFQSNPATNILVARNPWAADLNFLSMKAANKHQKCEASGNTLNVSRFWFKKDSRYFASVDEFCHG